MQISMDGIFHKFLCITDILDNIAIQKHIRNTKIKLDAVYIGLTQKLTHTLFYFTL